MGPVRERGGIPVLGSGIPLTIFTNRTRAGGLQSFGGRDICLEIRGHFLHLFKAIAALIRPIQ